MAARVPGPLAVRWRYGNPARLSGSEHLGCLSPYTINVGWGWWVGVDSNPLHEYLDLRFRLSCLLHVGLQSD
jgi:hypothetical protein